MLRSAKYFRNQTVNGEAEPTNRVCTDTTATAVAAGGSVAHDVVVRLVTTGSLQ